MTRPSAALAAVFDELLNVRPGEGRRTALLFVHLFFAAAIFFLGRTVRDTLFLSRYPLSALPWMFVIYGAVSAAVALAYGRIADRMPRHHMIALSCLIGGVTYTAAWVGVRADWRLVYPSFYVWTEVVSNLFIVQFWTLAADLLDVRAAKRLFGTIGSARLLASVLVGLVTGAIVRVLGTPQLIFILVALMAAVAATALLISREARAERGTRPGERPRRRGPVPRAFQDPYVRLLAVVLLLAFTAVNIGDYQFKVIARATYREDHLARFFSLFYAASGTVAFLFQFFVTPRLLARAGVGWAMAVMPGAFGLSSAALVAWPRLLVASLMKFSDNGFQYTIQETTFQALYVPFPPEIKARARALLDVVVKPLGYAVAGLAVIAFAARLGAHPQRFALVTLPLTAAWLGLVPLVRRRYLFKLEAAVSARGALALDHEFVLDAGSRGILVRALEHADSRMVHVALEQLSGVRTPDVTRAVERLAAHPDQAIRAAALYHLAHAGGDGDSEPARRALTDPVPDVRAAAAAAYASLARDEAVDELAPLLADPAPDVRVASLAGLLGQGGVEGGIVGGAELGRLLTSGEPAERVTAARALRHLGSSAFRPVRRLLEDPEPAVRRAAVKAAPGVPDPRLVPLLLAMLGDRACRHRAGQALIAIGAASVRPLAGLLQDPRTSRAIRLEIPRLMKRIPLEDSYEQLREHVRVNDSHLRLRIHAALSHLRRELSRPAEPLPFIQELVRAEIAESYGNSAGWEKARPNYETPLLVEVFQFRQQRAVRRVLRILELRYDRNALALVREHLADPKRRATALEVLDTLLDPSLRPLVMPFVDEIPIVQKLAHAGSLVPQPGQPSEFMAAHCRHPNPYVVLVAFDALARKADPVGASEGAQLLAHSEALVREGSLLALAAADPQQAAALLPTLATDDDPVVARLAARALALVTGRATQEGKMYSTVEKVLLLKSAPIFARVAGEDLAPLARVAEVEVYSPGQAIVSEGETGDALFIIVRGNVSISHSGHTITTLGPGETVGEMAVLDSEPRSATASALEETEVLRIGSEEFYEILHEQVEIAEGVIRMLCSRVRELDVKLARSAA